MLSSLFKRIIKCYKRLETLVELIRLVNVLDIDEEGDGSEFEDILLGHILTKLLQVFEHELLLGDELVVL